ARAGTPGDLDEIVSRTYRGYQDLLRSTTRYDREGTYWVATEQIRAHGLPPALGGLEVIALDGFDDFTQSQFRLLEALVPHLGHLVFGVACPVDDPSAQDLFRIPLD